MPEAKPIPNHKLRYERDRRAWSQQKVADMVGTTPLNVGRWERGITLPGPYFRQKLCEVFEKSVQELGLVQQPVDAVPAVDVLLSTLDTSLTQEGRVSYWNVPYNRNLFFTGREDILTQLQEALLNGEHPIALTQPQAISGLGGIGKTQTAVEYAYRFRDNYDAVLWARADSDDLLTSDFLLIAALLNLPQSNQQDQSTVIKAVLRWFDMHERWLLILDNADNLEMVSHFIPLAGKGHVLLTTRANSTGTIALRIEIEKMDLDEGVVFLLRRMKYLKDRVGLERVPEKMLQQAQNIVEIVDGLPLALDQAGAYVEETGCTLSDYLKFFKTRRKRLLRKRGDNASGHPEPVSTTWSLSFEKVEQANPAAADLLRLCAFLHPDEIPESMIVKGASKLGPILQLVAEDEFELNGAIGELRKYSLVKRDPELKLLNIHRLVQVVIKDAMDKETQREWAVRMVRMVNQAFPEVEFATWHQCQQYLPHAQVCAELIEQWNITLPEAPRLLNAVGRYLLERAKYAEAERLYQQALTMLERETESLLSVAQTLNNLAFLFYLQGQFSKAEPLFQRALAIREQQLGTNHPDKATSLDNLGELYFAQGKFVEAEPLYQQALAIREQQLGPYHPDTATSLNNIMVLYIRQGKYAESEPSALKALAIREEQLGPYHPDTAYSLNNLARLYDLQGRYNDAESILHRSLTIYEQQQGPEHPDKGYALFSLGLVKIHQGKYEDAEPLMQHSLAIYEQHLSLHPDTYYILNGLAIIYWNQKRYIEAETLLHRALSIQEQGFGPDHYSVAQTLNNLGLLNLDQHKPDQAKPFFLRALAIREQSLGLEHPETAQTLNDLARLYLDQNQWSEAEPLIQRALAIREQRLGLDHSLTAESLHNLARLNAYQSKTVAENGQLWT
jgi:tetratricopeptide (TPR) repeat protein/transcriptional regulator with XRE-family HTH domain